LHLKRDRDWPQIAALYGQPAAVDRSPVVALNQAIAVGEANGPAAGLEPASMGRVGIEPTTLGLRGPCSAN
jgi:predicted RNA polymerase sigma factor